ncbi:MAG: GW dipeptide domain-containing protein [Bryobacteraceae bacterium]
MRDSYTRFAFLVIAVIFLFELAACSSESSSNSLGDAYVAPASLNLHSSLATKSATVAVLKHGEHLTVIDVKRRYVKVRTDKGAQGWLDARQLLNREQMNQFRQNAARDLRLVSQGRATAFDALNVHIDPDRQSPAFAQIPAGGAVEVLAHKAIPKLAKAEPAPAPLFTKPATELPQRHKHPPRKNLSLLPPLPPPPGPPPNWQELSAERIGGPTESDQLKEKAEQQGAKKGADARSEKLAPLEDWSLIRTKDGTIGWVLSRNLYMSIPDEVAQYAEGQRISSYFDLGTVEDEEKGTKHDWLWTTSSEPQAFDFDRFRVFYWNRRRHRYETSYRQKDLTGFFPVEVEPASPGDAQRRFSVILQDDNGRYWKKRYSFDGTLVHLVSTEPYEPPAGNGPTKAAPPEIEKVKSNRPQGSWLSRQYDKLRKMIGH